MSNWIAGQRLEGNNGTYIIESILNSGGFGITYKATNERTKKPVAIKTLNNNLRRRQDFNRHQQKFVNEALTVARYNHPHIVKVYEVFEAGDLWHMVMEYIEGTTLADYLEDNGVIPEAEALALIQKVGEALSYVHSLGYCHRDIKPLNIMLRNGVLDPVLIDFGLARELTSRLKTNTYVGTECFAPIEQYQEKALIAPYSDVYALSATLYVLLTLQVPYPSDIRYKSEVLAKSPLPQIPPKQYNSRMSERVNDAILQGLELLPQNRPQTMQEWLELLPAPNPSYSGRLRGETEEDDLSSDKGVDYSKLRDLLKAGKWKEADEETLNIMLEVVVRQEQGWLREKDIDQFPCTDLCTLDSLWGKYSNGRFGFSTQKRIYQSLGGTRQCNMAIWETFGDAVGWRIKNEWIYYFNVTDDTSAPEGHFPVIPLWSRLGWRNLPLWDLIELAGFTWCDVGLFASRLVKCNI